MVQQEPRSKALENMISNKQMIFSKISLMEETHLLHSLKMMMMISGVLESSAEVIGLRKTKGKGLEIDRRTMVEDKIHSPICLMMILEALVDLVTLEDLVALEVVDFHPSSQVSQAEVQAQP